MKISLYAAVAALALAAPAFAAGDAEKGAKEFKKCMTCHSITAPDGTVINKGGVIGPNLYGVVGRTVGTYPEFAYSDSYVAAGAAGKAWTVEDIAAYVADPLPWIKAASGDDKAKTKMTFKLPKGGEDVAAYLASVVQ
jgi:cytochrome c